LLLKTLVVVSRMLTCKMFRVLLESSLVRATGNSSGKDDLHSRLRIVF
jgi:hypothetical protein